jgi:uncharacterized membrane protein YkoI
MTRTRILTALVAGLTLAGVCSAAAALADPASASALVAPIADTTTFTSTTTAPASAGAGVSADDAGRTAVDRLGGGTVTKVEREVEHGRQVWEIAVRRGAATTKVHVDTVTGAVTRIDDRGGVDRRSDDGRSDDRSGGHGGRHGGDDGPGHDRFDDHGGDR